MGLVVLEWWIVNLGGTRGLGWLLGKMNKVRDDYYFFLEFFPFLEKGGEGLITLTFCIIFVIFYSTQRKILANWVVIDNITKY